VLSRALGVAAGQGIAVHALHGSPLQVTFVVDAQLVGPLARELHRATG